MPPEISLDRGADADTHSLPTDVHDVSFKATLGHETRQRGTSNGTILDQQTIELQTQIKKLGAMLGFGADAWLNNTAFRAKSIIEFLKYEAAWLFFFFTIRPRYFFLAARRR
jgi:hypothetical protein